MCSTSIIERPTRLHPIFLHPEVLQSVIYICMSSLFFRSPCHRLPPGETLSHLAFHILPAPYFHRDHSHFPCYIIDNQLGYIFYHLTSSSSLPLVLSPTTPCLRTPATSHVGYHIRAVTQPSQPRPRGSMFCPRWHLLHPVVVHHPTIASAQTAQKLAYHLSISLVARHLPSLIAQLAI
jgi:hypothetical protein